MKAPLGILISLAFPPIGPYFTTACDVLFF